MPKVSIIVPVYNAEKYISRCIESVLSQDFNDYELILINDGSEDRSLEVCETYRFNYKQIKVFSQKKLWCKFCAEYRTAKCNWRVCLFYRCR